MPGGGPLVPRHEGQEQRSSNVGVPKKMDPAGEDAVTHKCCLPGWVAAASCLRTLPGTPGPEAAQSSVSRPPPPPLDHVAEPHARGQHLPTRSPQHSEPVQLSAHGAPAHSHTHVGTSLHNPLHAHTLLYTPPTRSVCTHTPAHAPPPAHTHSCTHTPCPVCTHTALHIHSPMCAHTPAHAPPHAHSSAHTHSPAYTQPHVCTHTPANAPPHVHSSAYSAHTHTHTLLCTPMHTGLCQRRLLGAPARPWVRQTAPLMGSSA
uniref:Uncharacterized protein n=1 Tax=Pelusios castaneus TaxID=367368 RepID=A0A8C8SEJ2_9SAUR